MSEEQSAAPFVNPRPPLRLLSVDDILSAKDLEPEDFPVPEWDGYLVLRGMSRGQHKAVIARSTEKKIVKGDLTDVLNPELLEKNIFLSGVIEPQFTGEQYDALKEKSFAVVERVVRRLLVINGMRREPGQEPAQAFRKGPA